MADIVKEVFAGELPKEWQAELGVSADVLVRVSIEEVSPRRSPEEVERLLTELRDIKPVSIEGDSTDFIRRARDRIDVRSKPDVV